MGVSANGTQNILNHSVDVRQHGVVPIAQHAVAIRFENFRAVIIGSRSRSVLAAIDLDNDLPRVTSKINDVTANANLTTEMRALGGKPVAEVPPKFPFSFCRRRPHLAGELALSWHD